MPSSVLPRGTHTHGGHPSPSAAFVRVWCCAAQEDGNEYFWHTETKERVWKQPRFFELSKVKYDLADGTLGASGRVIAGDGSPGSPVRVENRLVFERPLFNLGTPWRLCSF